MNQSNNSNTSYSSIDTQRKLRIEKMKKLAELGHNPFPAQSQRDFTLEFVAFWFDFVHKHDFPGRIWQMQKNLDARLEFQSEAVLANLIVHQAFAEDSLDEAEEYTKEWIDSQEDSSVLYQNFEEYIQVRRKIINEIKEFLDSKEGYNDIQKLDLIDEYFQEADFAGEHKPALITGQEVTLAGRVKSKRGSGKISFLGVEDMNYPQGFQFLLKVDEVEGGEDSLSYADFKSIVEEGDYVQATGQLDYSQSGEPSLFVKSIKILTKSIRPLPDKLEDVEQKYRQRYADMKLNPEVREMFIQKSRFWSATREFMVDNGFLEVSMPTLEETTGGAEAEPFVTHHNALDQDFYLRISSELHQKRMIVGGFEKIFDIDKNYRNEGIDDEHLQEYTQMEFYWAYADYNNLLDYCEDLMKYVIQETFGSLELEHEGQKVDWSKDWPRMPYYDFVEKFAGIKLADYDTVEKLQNLATKLGLEYEESAGKGRLIDLIYKKTARPKCIEPVWLIDIPVDVSPLAKRKTSDPNLTERVQLIAYGSELCNGYSELNDPVDQLNRFKEQQALREAGDGEAMMLDHDYVRALEIGMPPTAGFAYSERLFSVLLGKPIRETTPFPLMRSEENKVGKEKETQVAHSIILKKDGIELWEQINAASHLTAAFAARVGQKLFFSNSSRSKDGEQILMNIQNAIVIKQTDSSDKLLALKRRAEELGVVVSTFTKDMLDSSDDSKVMEGHATKDINDIEFRGVLVFGKIKAVKELTKEFELWSSEGSVPKKETSIYQSGNTRLLALEDNTYLFECDAKVIEKGVLEDKKYIILDQTVFYPQGGGQPSDIGTISSGSNVFEVEKCQRIEDKIYHFGSGADNFEVGESVKVNIDEELRRLHARIHTAGHMIDEAVKNLGLDIVADKGYHFPQGPYVQYLGELENASDYIDQLNEEINKIVSQNAKISYQMFEKNNEPERIMSVEGYNACKCGGTHVQNLNEIGQVNIRKIKSKKGVVKVSYEVIG